jgi:hypothetical protein
METEPHIVKQDVPQILVTDYDKGNRLGDGHVDSVLITSQDDKTTNSPQMNKMDKTRWTEMSCGLDSGGKKGN